METEDDTAAIGGRRWNVETSGAQDKLRSELQQARRQRHGLTSAVMAESPVLCALMGDGDPELAQVELGRRMYEYIMSDDDADAIEALYYSLGYTGCHAETHTARLEEYASDRVMELRQARRYSDRGIEQALSLITTRWLTRTVPELTVLITQPDGDTFTIQLRARWQRFLSMCEPEVQVWREDEDPGKNPEHTVERGETEEFAFVPMSLRWDSIQSTDGNGHLTRDGLWYEAELAEPASTPVSQIGDTSVLVRWRGSVWPRFTAILADGIEASMIKTETIGAANVVTLTR